MKILTVLVVTIAVYFGAFDDTAKPAKDAINGRHAQIERMTK